MALKNFSWVSISLVMDNLKAPVEDSNLLSNPLRRSPVITFALPSNSVLGVFK